MICLRVRFFMKATAARVFQQQRVVMEGRSWPTAHEYAGFM